MVASGSTTLLLLDLAIILRYSFTITALFDVADKAL